MLVRQVRETKFIGLDFTCPIVRGPQFRHAPEVNVETDDWNLRPGEGDSDWKAHIAEPDNGNFAIVIHGNTPEEM